MLFNRFNQPDFDLETLDVVTRPLISRDVTTRRSACRCVGIAILFARVAADFAATGGVHQAQDALKLLMAGANVMMLASALLVISP